MKKNITQKRNSKNESSIKKKKKIPQQKGRKKEKQYSILRKCIKSSKVSIPWELKEFISDAAPVGDR